MGIRISGKRRSVIEHMSAHPQETVLRAMIAGATKEFSPPAMSGDEPNKRDFGPEFVQPRFSPYVWMAWLEHSTRLKRCLTSQARSSVGLGIRPVVPDDIREEYRGRRNLLYDAERGRQRLKSFLKRPNSIGDPLQEVLFKAEYDLGGSGQGHLEVIENERDAGQQIVGIQHAKTVGMRAHRGGDKFCRLLRNGGKVYFRRFGDDDPDHKFIDRKTGEFFSTWPKKLPESRRGTAILRLVNYCPLDDFYGEPSAVSAVNAMATNRLEGKWNIMLLKNSAHIPMAVIAENVKLSPDTREQIEAFVQTEAKGLDNVGRILIVEPDTDTLAPNANPKLRLEPMKMGTPQDGDFLKLREANNAEIQEAVGAASVLATGNSMTRATAQIVKQLIQEQVNEPRTQCWESQLNMNVAPVISGGEAEFRIRRPKNLDDVQRAAVLGKLKDGLTAQEFRPLAAEILQTEIDADAPDYSDVLLGALSDFVKQGVQISSEKDFVESGNGVQLPLPWNSDPRQV